CCPAGAPRGYLAGDRARPRRPPRCPGSGPPSRRRPWRPSGRRSTSGTIRRQAPMATASCLLAAPDPAQCAELVDRVADVVGAAVGLLRARGVPRGDALSAAVTVQIVLDAGAVDAPVAQG